MPTEGPAGVRATAAIPPFRYSFTDRDVDFIVAEVRDILESESFLTMGPRGERLEEEFRAHAGARYAVAVASGTAALEIVLRALEVRGGRVIVPTNTFGASAVSVLRAGATPVLADCAEDLSLSPAAVRELLSPEVRAVVTVHIGGLVSPHTLELRRLCERHGVPLVEDAAHAAGASLGGVRAGGFGVAAAFSFFSTKVMTCGEGGMITTGDERIRDQALLLRDHAKDETGAMASVGYNWRLTEMQAVLGLAQLRRLDEMIARRNEIAAIFDLHLAGLDGVKLLPVPAGAVHNRYKYVVFLGRHEPEAVRKRLREEHGITLGGYVYAVPLHRQGAFAPYCEGASFPVADRLCGSHVCPPLYPSLSDADARYIAESLRSVLE